MVGYTDDGVPVVPSRSLRRRRVIMPLIAAVAVAVIVLILVTTGRQPTLVGSGSTLAQPLIERSAAAFRDAQSADNPDRPGQTGNDWVLSGEGVEYEPVGSLGGIMRLGQDGVVFAVSDYPLSTSALDDRGATQFPIAAGAIAVVHSLELADGARLRLDAPTLSAIYRGELTRWDDPAVVALNPGVALPDLAITPVHRTDGSGSTYGLTAYLSAGSPEWEPLGTGATISWPTDTGAERSSGMIDALRGTEGAIGYVDQGQAERAGLQSTDLANAAGRFIGPTPESMAAAIADVNWSAADGFASSAPTVEAPDAYPMTVGIYALLQRETTADTSRALSYLSFLLDRFDVGATELGYLPLPAAAVDAVRAYWADTFNYRA